MNEENSILLADIKQSESVCVHIRLGDYLKYAAIYDVLVPDYYEKGIEYIKNKVREPKFFVFSDEPDKAKLRLAFLENAVFINHHNPGYEDLRLMMNCKHFIIPNSTFSWWAQYLCRNPNKIVIAPKKWFNGLPYCDILMENWITY